MGKVPNANKDNDFGGLFSVNVCARISINGPRMCWQIYGQLTAEYYINILDSVIFPSVREVFADHFSFKHVRKQSGVPVNVYNNNLFLILDIFRL